MDFTCSLRGGREETDNFVKTVEALDRRRCRWAAFKQESRITATETARTSLEWTRTKVRASLWAGLATFAPIVGIATVAGEALPHVRATAFVQEIRFARMTPACAIRAARAAFLYVFLKERVGRPWMLSAFVFVALVVLVPMGIAREPGLLRAATPAVLGIAAPPVLRREFSDWWKAIRS